MKIEVYNLNKMLKITDKESSVGLNLISIRDVLDSPCEKYMALDRHINKRSINAKIVYFDDADRYRWGQGLEHPCITGRYSDGGEPTFFNESIAKDIIDYVGPLWEKDHDVRILIHCWAGRSRSQAVAYWLNIYYNLILTTDIESFNWNNARNVTEKIHFNCDVLKVFTNLYGSKTNEIQSSVQQ